MSLNDAFVFELFDDVQIVHKHIRAIGLTLFLMIKANEMSVEMKQNQARLSFVKNIRTACDAIVSL